MNALAEAMRESAEDFVRQAGIAAGMRVLDLGCGDGGTALPAAKLGARVTGVEAAGALVDAAARRAKQAGLAGQCTFLRGDACDLRGLENGSFDLVLSLCGLVSAPRPLDVAREMVRVTRPGGRIVLGCWMPGSGSLVAQLLEIAAPWLPAAADGAGPPLAWGSTPRIVERFGAAGVAYEAIGWVRDSCVLDFQGSPAQLVDVLRAGPGPIRLAFEAAAGAGRAQELHDALAALFQARNQSQYPGTTLLVADLLKVTVERG